MDSNCFFLKWYYFCINYKDLFLPDSEILLTAELLCIHFNKLWHWIIKQMKTQNELWKWITFNFIFENNTLSEHKSNQSCLKNAKSCPSVKLQQDVVCVTQCSYFRFVIFGEITGETPYPCDNLLRPPLLFNVDKDTILSICVNHLTGWKVVSNQSKNHQWGAV